MDDRKIFLIFKPSKTLILSDKALRKKNDSIGILVSLKI